MKALCFRSGVIASFQLAVVSTRVTIKKCYLGTAKRITTCAHSLVIRIQKTFSSSRFTLGLQEQRSPNLGFPLASLKKSRF